MHLSELTADAHMVTLAAAPLPAPCRSLYAPCPSQSFPGTLAFLSCSSAQVLFRSKSYVRAVALQGVLPQLHAHLLLPTS